MSEVYNLRIGDMVWNTHDTTGEVSNIVGLVYKLTPKYAYYAVCARLRHEPDGQHFITKDHKVKKSKLYESIKNNQKVILRNPKAVRPWQHVLDVLHGYLLLGQKLYDNPKEFSESFNFSPVENKEVNVEEVVNNFISAIGNGSYEIDLDKANLHEATMLKLDSSKAFKRLNWTPKFKTTEAISKTALWYKDYLEKSDIKTLCQKDLNNFIKL